jgi:polysaccharide export outer membrane protein
MKTSCVFVVVLLLGATGCAHPVAPFTWVYEIADQDSVPASTRFAIDDQVLITVWNQPLLSGPHRVRADGMVTLPLVGDIALVGLTPDGASSRIASALDGLVVEPKVAVELVATLPQLVSVVGEVRTPGRFELRAQAGVLELLAQAGGLTEFADRDGIYVVRRDSNVPRVRFRYQQLEQGEPKAVGFALRDGDVIVVE